MSHRTLLEMRLLSLEFDIQGLNILRIAVSIMFWFCVLTPEREKVALIYMLLFTLYMSHVVCRQRILHRDEIICELVMEE